QQQIAQIGANECPTIRREKSEPWGKIIAVAAQILNLERFRIWSRVLALIRELSDNTCQALAVNPGAQPTANVSAARDGGLIVELVEQTAASEALQHS